jgi:hypothetical protein
VAESLGTPLLPWQRYVADVATERRDDGSYEYETVVVTVPRQTGKTTLIRAVGVHRAAILRRDTHYTAQTGKDARKRWSELVEIVESSEVWKGRTSKSLRGGDEHLNFGKAAFHCFAPVKDCLHGSTPATVVLDEAFALDAAKGAMMMGAISPAQQTIRARQRWIVSTAGTADSTFLHDWIDRAADGMPRVALFDWGATDDQDPYDLDDIAAYHPGIGFLLNERVLTPLDVLAELENNTRAEYERAFANRRTVTVSHLIPTEVWRGLRDLDPEPPTDTSRVTLTYDVSLDRRSGAILASWPGPDGRPRVRVVKSGPGVEWLAPALVDLRADWRPRAVAAVGNGPVLEVTADLRARGEEVRELTEREWSTATGRFLTAIDEAAFAHHGTPQGDDLLTRSVTGLVTRAGAVDGVAVSKRHSVGDSSAGCAAVAGVWLTEQAAHEGKPKVRVPA